MQWIRQKLSILLSLILVCSALFGESIFAEELGTGDFDEFGFRIETDGRRAASLSNGSNFVDLGTAQNVPLQKMWTVHFSKNVNLNDIEAITIQRDQEFVPVRIGLGTTSHHIVVSPATSFSGNNRYELRVILANGKRYKKVFYTLPENRMADAEPNNDIQLSSPIELNETIDGILEQGDKDYYKITVPEHGMLSLKLQSLKDKEFYFYNTLSTEKKYSNYGNTIIHRKIAVLPGTYYMAVKNASSKFLRETYTLATEFTPSKMSNDSADWSPMTMKEIPFGTPIQGLIGYLDDQGGENRKDYYKIVAPRDGILRITGNEADGKPFDMTLYGDQGPDSSYLKYSSKRLPLIELPVKAGTYYLVLNRYNSDNPIVQYQIEATLD